MDTTPSSPRTGPSTRALVLAGGGAAGNAWQLGLIAGLCDAGVDLTAAELIIGTNGIGFMMMDATKWYGTDTVICGIIIIGLLWLVFDRFVFAELERVTARRWGMLTDG